jgi:pre-rRNA-processing protein TSR4
MISSLRQIHSKREFKIIMAEALWLGEPAEALTPAALGDAYTSRIGGVAAWLRPPPPAAKCSKCKASLTLLTQLHAPLKSDDRILYVFACGPCGAAPAKASTGRGGARPVTGAVPRLEPVVLRCQAYNPEYDAPAPAQAPPPVAAPPAPSTFDVDDDWGDDDSTPTAPAPAPSKVAPAPPAAPVADAPKAVENTRPAPVLCAPGVCSADPRAFPALCLEIYEAPTAASAAPGDDDDDSDVGVVRPSDVAAQLADVAAAHPNAEIDVDGAAAGPEEDERDVDKGAPKVELGAYWERYLKAIQAAPRQCVRWQPDGLPLWAARPPRSDIPPCSGCGAPRRFEFQLVSPLLHFLSLSSDAKGKKPQAAAAAATASGPYEFDFATIVVFTCSANCDSAPYNAEYAVVQDEPGL